MDRARARLNYTGLRAREAARAEDCKIGPQIPRIAASCVTTSLILPVKAIRMPPLFRYSLA
jgi:hypothetical protein